MQAIQNKPFSLPAVLSAAFLVCLPLIVAPAGSAPWVLIAIAAAVIVLMLAHVGNLLTMLLAWLGVTSVVGFHFWVHDIPGFFNVTVDRLVLVALVLTFLLGVGLGRYHLRRPGWLGGVLVLLVAWVALSAQAAGWRLPAESSPRPDAIPPYYRFFAGFVFPALLFFMAVSAVGESERDLRPRPAGDRAVRAVLLFFTLFGLYLTIVGLAAKLGWAWLVWPRYILDKSMGIHPERVRGPFLNAPDMGLTLVVCFFATLLLATKVRTFWRLALGLIALPMPVLIFLTMTRSVWVGFVLCIALAIWFWPRSGSIRLVLGLATAAAMVLAAFLLWDRLSTSDREAGGIADPAPIISRYELSMVSVDLALANPAVGVGLGHFQQAAMHAPRMTEFASRTAAYGQGAVEHNNLLSMLAETGVPGALLYALLVFGLLGVSIALYRRIPPQADGWLDRRFVVFYWIIWVSFFIDSMFRLTTSSPFPNGMFLLMGGLIVGLCNQSSISPRPS